MVSEVGFTRPTSNSLSFSNSIASEEEMKMKGCVMMKFCSWVIVESSMVWNSTELPSVVRGRSYCCLVDKSYPTLCDSVDYSLQAPLSMVFSRQEYWSGLPFPSPRDLPDPGIKPVSPVLAGGFFTTEPPGKQLNEGRDTYVRDNSLQIVITDHLSGHAFASSWCNQHVTSVQKKAGHFRLSTLPEDRWLKSGPMKARSLTQTSPQAHSLM